VLTRRIFGSIALAAMPAFAACGGQDGFAQPAIANARQSSASATKSWMAPEAHRADLLYVSDGGGAGSVYVFSYPRGDLVGTLSGFDGLTQSVCSDRAGDVFVAVFNLGGNEVVEYAHGATAPIATLAVPGEPVGCSVDPTTGNLAVAIYSYDSSPGSIAVYRNAVGNPSIFRNPNMSDISDCTYDDGGNLFVSGVNDRGFALGELPAGGTTLESVALKGKGSGAYLEPIAWDGSDLAIGDFDGYGRVYEVERVRVDGRVARILGERAFALSHGVFSGDSRFSIYQGSIIFPYQSSNGVRAHKGQAGFWKYSLGGAQAGATGRIGSQFLDGVTVSAAARR
jgi:hypothetical protein